MFEIFGLKPDPNGRKFYHMREFYRGCDKNPIERKEESSSTASGSGSVVIEIKDAKTDGPHPEVLSGSRSLSQEDGSKLEVRWELTRAVPKLYARITGPMTFTRGDIIALDGTRSGGDIVEYSWRFDYGHDCTAIPANPDLVLKGPKISFKAICDFIAHLDIKDSLGHGAYTRLSFKAKAREGEAWRLKLDHHPGKNIDERMVIEHMRNGVNQCAKHSENETTGHQIHTTAKNNATWIDDGYEVEEVND